MPKISFGKAMTIEGGLVGIAWVLTWLLGVPLFADLQFNARGCLLGITSTLPMLALFAWMLQSQFPPCVEIRECLDAFVPQTFGDWTVTQLALLSLMAGVGEEILFRGVLQAGVASHTNAIWGVLVASLLFALCHAITSAYFITTLFIGFYLSIVWQAAGNLLAPIITHALYDFIALYYFLRVLNSNKQKPASD